MRAERKSGRTHRSAGPDDSSAGESQGHVLIFTFWLSVLVLLGFGFTFVVGTWWWIVLGYVLAGVAWVLHDSTRPFIYQPVGYMTRRGTLKLWLTWPYGVTLAAIDRWKALRSPERFSFSINSQEEAFSSLTKALSSAKGTAAELNQLVLVFDRARFYWDLMTQQWSYIYYIVEPTGEVERADVAQLKE